ncbi:MULTISPECIES: GNAT family N-acetyltransferase [Agrobacterium tumefaciens complex]|jgi:putative acetyltransferase|uniref:Acetyltransferase n=1 Tax=Agrobacterium tumefaciens str. Kerr 14 TaxID=1183424 RepID=A0A1S7NSQ5_AGRTU|nr:GNAT family N-acetyltransferase [Agrobacterium tumefaciens]AYM81587.1 acetyltransferase [Agrobacterium tumefaciens]EHH07651.1 acetyltransferase [Agrobacterium tumefaciens CCNWGS0286]MBP2535151.1 putative acetyltransferase [Agrobacterium tumefaciens]MCW8057586.1 GNAT family N-acetyltransferase [Agrobacterium tumefaciens]MCW8146866.1 GNAT family N-acetyltransferase [Agrobacterium tumefaciens]
MQNVKFADNEDDQFRLRDILLRAPRLDDAEALTELFNLPGVRHGTLRQPFQSVEKTRKAMENRGPNDISIIGEWRGKIVANGGLFRRAGRQAHIADLAISVHDDLAGKGVGSHLLGALIDTADNWHDIRRIELNVFTDNLPAIRLYEKFGFEREGTLRNDAYRDGKYVDAHVMARLR